MANKYRRILVIEDDVLLQSVLLEVLHRIDGSFELTWVKSVDAAWDKMNEGKKFDLIIADVMLEGKLTGIDFWRTLGTRDRSTPLVLISSCSEYEVLRTIDEIGSETGLGAPAFIPKPLRLGECRQVLEGVLKYAS